MHCLLILEANAWHRLCRVASKAASGIYWSDFCQKHQLGSKVDSSQLAAASANQNILTFPLFPFWLAAQTAFLQGFMVGQQLDGVIMISPVCSANKSCRVAKYWDPLVRVMLFNTTFHLNKEWICWTDNMESSMFGRPNLSGAVWASLLPGAGFDLVWFLSADIICDTSW